MISRENYMRILRGARDKQIIKVVTGIRRCGKSTLLEMFRDELTASGVASEQITSINFEDPDNGKLCESGALYLHIKQRLIAGKMNYIFLDEIQNVSEWEKCVDGLFLHKNCDIYITGSNSYMLSGELATLLTGRYIEIKMLPLSFAEYLSVNTGDVSAVFRAYLERSSFPFLVNETDRQQIRLYLEGLVSTVMLNDIVNRKKIADVSVLQAVTRFMFDNIAGLTSSNNIASTLNSAGRNISVPTVENYLEALCECFLLYRVNRFDVKGRQLLKTGHKYYAADMGLRTQLLGSGSFDMGKALENTMYLELLRRGYEVYIGKKAEFEIDFVANSENGTEYYQVALTTRDENTLKRELRPLDTISDHNPKYLLTLDNEPVSDYNGIKKVYALDWVLERKQ